MNVSALILLTDNFISIPAKNIFKRCTSVPKKVLREEFPTWCWQFPLNYQLVYSVLRRYGSPLEYSTSGRGMCNNQKLRNYASFCYKVT